MARGLSDLQKRIITTMWRKRCECRWEPTYDTWIGPGCDDDWLDDTDMWENPDNWQCMPDTNCRREVISELLRGMSTESERKKVQTSLNRAIDRLLERGLVELSVRNRRYAEWMLTPWGCLYGWLLHEGRSISQLAGRSHKRKQKISEASKQAALSRLREAESEISEAATGRIGQHNQIVQQLEQLEPWQQEYVLSRLKLMVETCHVGPESTNSSPS